MDDDSRLSLIIVALLIALAAFFAVAETALSSVSKNKIKVASDRGDTRAEKALFVLDNFDQAITTLLICTNIVHISAATVVTVTVTRIWGLSAVTLSTIISTLVLFFAGEMLPKTIAKKNSFNLSLSVAGTVKFLMKVFKPAADILAGIGKLAANATGAEPEVTVTEDELVDMIEDLEEEGAIDEDQSDLLQATMDFGDTWVKHIMTPIDKVIGLNVDGESKKLHEQIMKSTHSRMPVYEDKKYNIIGVVQIRKYMREYVRINKDSYDDIESVDDSELVEHSKSVDHAEAVKYPEIRSIMDEVYIANRNTPIDELLERMSHRKLNMAVIQGTDMNARGIVTIEDILEELVGEIYDEFDTIPKNTKRVLRNSWKEDSMKKDSMKKDSLKKGGEA